MVYSMTGFGRSEGLVSGKQVIVIMVDRSLAPVSTGQSLILIHRLIQLCCRGTQVGNNLRETLRQISMSLTVLSRHLSRLSIKWKVYNGNLPANNLRELGRLIILVILLRLYSRLSINLKD